MIKKIHTLWLPLIGSWISTPALLAAEEQARQPSPTVEFLYAFLPIAFIGLVLFWFLRKSQRTPFMQRSMEYYQRAEQHMQRMEQLGERMAAALEKINKAGE